MYIFFPNTFLIACLHACSNNRSRKFRTDKGLDFFSGTRGIGFTKGPAVGPDWTTGNLKSFQSLEILRGKKTHMHVIGWNIVITISAIISRILLFWGHFSKNAVWKKFHSKDNCVNSNVVKLNNVQYFWI